MWFDLGTPRIILLQSPALGSEQARFHTIKESKDIDKIPLTELVGNRNNIILGVPRSNHKEQGKFKDNVIIINKNLVKTKNNFCLVIVNKNNSDNLFKSIM